MHVECESKRDTGIDRGDWNHLKTTQTIPELHIGKAQNRGITETGHIVHCTDTAGSAGVKVQNILHGRNNITCSRDRKYRTAATLCTIQTRFVSGI